MPNPPNVGNEGGSFMETGRLLSGSEVAILSSFLEAKDLAEEQRQRAAEHRLDIYEDDWLSILRDRIGSQYTSENAKELFAVADTTNNVLKRIVDDISTMYSRLPFWRFAGENPAWRRIYREARAAVVMPRVNRLTNLLNECLIYVAPHEGRLVFHPITPAACTVWQDPADPARLRAVLFLEARASTPGATPRWHYWTRAPDPVYRRYDAGGRVELEIRNPYVDDRGRSVLPFAGYHRQWPIGSYWNETSGRDLEEVTIFLGLWETWINHLQRTDSFRQKWASGLLDSSSSQQIGGTLNILQFRNPTGEPVALGEFSSQSDWGGLGNQAMRKLQNVLNANGMSISDFQVSGDVQSGFSLRVRKEGLIELRERQVPLYEVGDQELYAACAAVWNYERTNSRHGIDGPALLWPSEAAPEIRYAPFITAMTVLEQQVEFELRQRRIEVGLESPLSIYQAEHPDASEEEALEAIARNAEWTAKVRTLLKPEKAPESEMEDGMDPAMVEPETLDQTRSVPSPGNESGKA